MTKDIEAWTRNINQLRSALGDTQDDEPQWKKAWRARELAREKSGISLEREQQLLDALYENHGADALDALNALLHDEKVERMNRAAMEFLAGAKR